MDDKRQEPAAPTPAATTDATGAKQASSEKRAPKAPKPRVAGAPKAPKAPKPTVAGAPRQAPKPKSTGKSGKKPKKSSAEEERDRDAQARKGAKFLGAIVVIYIIYLVVSGQMGTFVEALSHVDLGWVGAACGCYGLYFIFGVAAYVVAVYLDHDSPVGIRDLMSVEASGIFFGNLTPMMAGAIPSQIYRLMRTGLDAGEASATQFTRFIMFQFGVVLFAAIMLLAKFQFFLDTYGDIVFLNLVVFFAHFCQLIVLFGVCLCPGLVKRVGNALLSFVYRRGWVKDYDRWYETVNVQVDEFAASFKTAATHIPDMIITLVITMAQLACLYMIPWFVLRAFGIEADFLACMAAGSMVQMVASSVPLPGGTGGAEAGFALFYGPLFGTSATAGYLIWRIVTFFGPTILSAPILGLRSHSRESIYVRVNKLLGRKVSPNDQPSKQPKRSGRKQATIKMGKGGARVTKRTGRIVFSSKAADRTKAQDKN